MKQNVIYPEALKPTLLARYLAGHLSALDLEAMEPGELESLESLLQHWQRIASRIIESRRAQQATAHGEHY